MEQTRPCRTERLPDRWRASVSSPRLGRTLAVPAPVPWLTGTPGVIRWLGPPLCPQAAQILPVWLGEKPV